MFHRKCLRLATVITAVLFLTIASTSVAAAHASPELSDDLPQRAPCRYRRYRQMTMEEEHRCREVEEDRRQIREVEEDRHHLQVGELPRPRPRTASSSP